METESDTTFAPVLLTLAGYGVSASEATLDTMARCTFIVDANGEIVNSTTFDAMPCCTTTDDKSGEIDRTAKSDVISRFTATLLPNVVRSSVASVEDTLMLLDSEEINAVSVNSTTFEAMFRFI